MKPKYEFHISRHARERYQIDTRLLGTNGRLIVTGDSTSPRTGFEAARRIADRVYAVTTKPMPASDLYAAALIEEILHVLIRHYERQNAGVMGRALEALRNRLEGRLDQVLLRFTEEFPPSAVYLRQQSGADYLAGVSEGTSNREVTLEEMLLVRVANANPALEPYREFFDEANLKETGYAEAIGYLTDFLNGQPALAAGSGAGAPAETLIEWLNAPAKAAPYSLEGQLQFLLDRWGELLGASVRLMVLRAMDFVREEVVRHATHGSARVSQMLPDFRGEAEYERFSLDRDWMPRLVLIAKNCYVWLEQLSRKYGRWIQTLDEIPDEELDLLARRGFTGLWLIGLWERSRASRRIKERMGGQEAVASAYSLHAYDIEKELGGWEALGKLRARAGQRGIRLSADMVPNHMGLDSRWVIEHPDWFLSLERPPYPSYRFNSENLGDDGRVGVYLEDHYYDHSDAAVVFQRRDHQTGEARYIYHGNDGTSYPWNDTAQLNYTRADVREAVIQTILHVARNFPIIRFDAAMTLARKHVQRLWFPEPGAGGAIPSRAEHGMTKAEFEAAMPNEFWREVVDRVAAEAPETLLLAEAFWLLEGYFVRTLGMHRVYNSAFMHMLRDEQNAEFRQLIKNTLEFDPQILKRYVNFMNNPDEETAVEQFGNGDKYFATCTLLATLPGLPMFGHGQIEGLREKYGMEYRKPRMEETVDEGLVRGHEGKIFPLLHRRALFADVEEFRLFYFYSEGGGVIENVLTYSNRVEDDRALVVCNNSYTSARGWIRTSAAAREKSTGRLVQKSLGEALGLPRSGYAIFRDASTHLEHIRACSELWERGFYFALGGYEHHVYLDWRLVEGGRWGELCEGLGGAGVESMDRKYSGLWLGGPRRATHEGEAAGGKNKLTTKGTKGLNGTAKAGKGERGTTLLAAGQANGTKGLKGTAKAAKKTTKAAKGTKRTLRAAKPRTTKAAPGKTKMKTTGPAKGGKVAARAKKPAAKKPAAAAKAKRGGSKTKTSGE